MNTRWSCSDHRRVRDRMGIDRPRFQREYQSRCIVWWTYMAAVAMVSSCMGCGYSQGELLYFLGVGRASVVEAKFRLTENPVLILLDDPNGRMDWPPAGSHFVDELGQALIRHKAARKVVPRRTLEGIRQSVPNFEKRGCREIGELAGAEQVVWVQVRDFLAEEQFQEIDRAAYFSAAVKVVNVKETRRTRVRLWPPSPTGYFITVSLSGSEVAVEKTKAAIAKVLAARLAEKVARLFYDYRLGDFERE